MDGTEFDTAVHMLTATGTRRGLLRFLTVLPLVSLLLALLTPESEAGRRSHHHRVHNRAQKTGQKATAQKHHKRKKNAKPPPPPTTCTPESVAQTCAGKCATVKNNCDTAIDCGACSCGSCQICQTCDAATGQCVANGSVVGQVCGTCHTCTAAGLCGSVNDGVACVSGNPCSQQATCQGGVCTAGPVVCTPLNACHDAGTRNGATGLCSNPAKVNRTVCGGSNICCNGTCCSGCCGSDGSCGACLVFVTADPQFDGNLSGLAGADAICQARANAASRPGTYKAWLSTGNGAGQNPLTRFRQSGMPYVLPDASHTPIADDWGDLTTCDVVTPNDCLDHAINVTEDGVTLPSGDAVWTNTAADATQDNAPQDCSAWTSAAISGAMGGFGDSAAADSLWTDSDNAPGC